MQKDASGFYETLTSYKDQIDNALKHYFESPQARLDLKLAPREEEAFSYLKEFTLRPGKRIRGALTIFAYEQFSGRDNPSIASAAVAMELMQSYLLIVDDVMDRSPTRRGRPALQVSINEQLGESHEHLANMLAINIGLLASHMAQLALLFVEEQPENLVKASEFFQRNIAITGYGQIDDLYNDLLAAASEDDIIRLHQRKNSYYSFISPFLVGAALAGKSSEKITQEIAAIGLPIGVAFQLQDDILGLFGDKKTTGKSSLDDLKEGKFTLLMLYALKHATAAQAAKIKAALGDNNITDAQAEEVRDIIKRTGALAAVSAKANDLSKEARKAVLSSTIFNEPAKAFLDELINFVVARKV